MTVDHDERRMKIAAKTAAVVAREGLNAATIRRIAQELGGPVRNVTYYFATKEELLAFTYRTLLTTQLAHAATDNTLAQNIQQLVDQLLALAAADEPRIARWRGFLAFWDQAAREPALAELQRQHLRLSFSRIAQSLQGIYGNDPDIDTLSMLLDAAIEGISVQILADPILWPEARIRHILTRLIAAFFAPQGMVADERKEA
jgi:AcrR family transcriptional regulator